MTSVTAASLSLRRALHPVLIGVLLLFGQICALRGRAVCEAGSARSTPGTNPCSGGEHSDEDCGEAGEPEHWPSAGCSHATVCCSSWAPAPDGETLPGPLLAVLPAGAMAPALAQAVHLAPGRVPIRTESPPPRRQVLRL